jgi:hypothetical protein
LAFDPGRFSEKEMISPEASRLGTSPAREKDEANIKAVRKTAPRHPGGHPHSLIQGGTYFTLFRAFSLRPLCAKAE